MPSSGSGPQCVAANGKFYRPVPLKLTVCGLVGSESVMARDAVRAPTAVGLKRTLIVQLPPPARLDPQVVVREKSPLFVPVMAMLEMLIAVVARFRRVTLVALLVVPTVRLANAIEVGDKETAVPVPLRLTVCGLVLALSATVTAALLVPTALGENVTEIVHELPAARLVPQVVDRAKSAVFVPVMAMLVMLKVAVPVFLSVTAVPVLVVPSCRVPNETDVGDKVTAGAVPVPVIGTE